MSPSDTALQEGGDQAPRAAGSSSRLEANTAYPRSEHGVLDGPVNRTGERVCHRPDHKAERAGLPIATPEISGVEIRVVVEALGCGPDLGDRRRRTFGSPLMTRDTVLMPTPARAATWRMVARDRRPGGRPILPLVIDIVVTVRSPIAELA